MLQCRDRAHFPHSMLVITWRSVARTMAGDVTGDDAEDEFLRNLRSSDIDCWKRDCSMLKVLS